MSARPSRGTQRGMLLIECMVVAALALALAVWGSHEWAERTRVLQARSLATWMETARDAVQAYLVREASALTPEKGEAIEPDASALSAPDWAALQAQGLLASGWQSSGPAGQTLGVRLWRSGGCQPGACRLNALVHTRTALQQRSGALDGALAAEWLLAAGGRGFVLWPHRPAVFSGAGEQVPLPPGSVDEWRPGMVALMAAHTVARSIVPGDGSGDGDDDDDGGGDDDDSGNGGGPGNTDDFLRVRDTRDPDFQNRVTAQGELRSDTRVVARESLVLEDGWRNGSACSTENAVGRDQNYAGLLICRQGQWRLVARASGGGFLTNTRRGCKNVLGTPTPNPYTGACQCPDGFAVLQVSESGSLTSADGLSSGYLCVPN